MAYNFELLVVDSRDSLISPKTNGYCHFPERAVALKKRAG